MPTVALRAHRGKSAAAQGKSAAAGRVPALLAAALLAIACVPAAGDPGRQLLRLTFLGDIMGHDVNFRMRDYGDIYRGVEDIFLRDDLTVGNLEFPVEPTLPVSGYPFFNASRGYLEAAVASGIDAFSLANNHAFDQREEGILQTLRATAAASSSAPRQVCFAGIRGNPAAPFAAGVVRVRGLRVGLLAATQFLNDAAGRPWVHVVDYTDPEAAERFRAHDRRESSRVDLLIVSYHGDAEYAGTPSPSKRQFFTSLAESGAHVVLGHHPHVVQGWEIVAGEGGTRLVMHSMGNFISGMTWRLSPSDPPEELPPRGESYLLAAEVLLTGGTVSVQAVEAVPIANYRNERGEMVVGRMRDLADGTVRVPAAWGSYWAGRLALMEKRISAWRAGRLR